MSPGMFDWEDDNRDELDDYEEILVQEQDERLAEVYPALEHLTDEEAVYRGLGKVDIARAIERHRAMMRLKQ